MFRYKYKLNENNIFFDSVLGCRMQLMNLCSSAVNSQMLLCSQKCGVKCSY